MDYTFTIHFDNPEDCAWFATEVWNHKAKVQKGSQLEGAGRSVMMAALGRSVKTECSMSLERIAKQRSGLPVNPLTH